MNFSQPSHLFAGADQPEVAFLYRILAVWEAADLPEQIPENLILLWTADTRGQHLRTVEDLKKFWLESKAKVELAERQGKVECDDHWVIRELVWVLISNSQATLADAVNAVAKARANGKRLLASESELSWAYDRFRDLIYSWLRDKDIFFSSKPQLLIPSTTLLRVFKQCEGRPDIHFAPRIPIHKLENACQAAAREHDKESIVCLIDCTFFGSSKEFVLFGDKAVYYKNMETFGFFPYSELSERTFLPDGESRVSLGDGQVIDLAGSQVRPIDLVMMMDILKSEAKRLQSRAAGSDESLSKLPGMANLKQLLLDEVVAPLKNPDQFKKYRIDIPNGILLYGPPGCGKTFVAQRLAGELNYNFFEVSPSTVGSPYIHESGRKIASLFESASKRAPAVLFVDEIDGLVPSRSYLTATQDFKAEEVNEWLVQIGSCAERKILFVAATNEPWKLDEALTRTGRLDKKVYVGPPDREALLEMLRYHLKGRPVSSEAEIAEFSGRIQGRGYSASDIKVLTDEAAKLAMKDNADISLRHLECAALEKVPPSITTEQEKRYAAFVASSGR